MAIGDVDGRAMLASGGRSDRTVRLWDAATGVPRGEPLRGHADDVNSVAVGRVDGRAVVASGSDDGTVRLWDAATGTLVATLPVLGPVAAVAFSGEGLIVGCGSALVAIDVQRLVPRE